MCFKGRCVLWSFLWSVFHGLYPGGLIQLVLLSSPFFPSCEMVASAKGSVKFLFNFYLARMLGRWWWCLQATLREVCMPRPTHPVPAVCLSRRAPRPPSLLSSSTPSGWSAQEASGAPRALLPRQWCWWSASVSQVQLFWGITGKFQTKACGESQPNPEFCRIFC